MGRERRKPAVSRRHLLTGGASVLVGWILKAGENPPQGATPIVGIPPYCRWGYLIDTTKCIGCGNCMRACRKENSVPEKKWRTWVERYLYIEEEGEIRLQIDAPEGGEHGYPKVDPKKVIKGFFVPKICNHCLSPSCVRVCPASATYVTREGVVLVDEQWCIGCGYCIQACPYNMRFLDEEKGVASKCTWCYHRITKGYKPACVIACPTGARTFGDLRNPEDPVTKAFRTKRVYVLRPETGNEPQVRYTELDKDVI